jgi:dTDP-4-amino-4,6-dideoxygalactose transaminase
MKVPFFDYTEIYKSDFPIYRSSLESVLKRADFILRDDLISFENSLANFVGTKYAVGVGNGTDAIWLGFHATGVGRGDEVILPAHTYVATADAIWAVGATPVVVDIQDDHAISPQAIEEAISPRTRAIVPVNLNGRAAPLEIISQIAKKYDLLMIEDNAQGLGARLNGKPAGSFGNLGTLSFYPAKILGGLGDGGAVITDDYEISEKIFRLRSHGRNRNNEVIEWGFNSRLDNLQAAVLMAKLNHLESNVLRRRKIADKYFELLNEIEEINLPQRYCKSNEDYFDSFQNYEIEANNRDALKSFLNSRGIGTLIQWGGKGIHQFELDGIIVKNVENANRIIESMLLLPMNQYLADDQIEYVCECVKEFYAKVGV